MKANELMVGDYLMHNGFPYRVIQVDGIVRDGWMIENGEEDCGEPIPLTPEILEKNGFICDGSSWWYLDFRIVLSTSKGVSLVCGRQKRFEFVHQLQHALRLCEIEKEIIL